MDDKIHLSYHSLSLLVTPFHSHKKQINNKKQTIMDYDEINEKMTAEREDRRQVEGMVKLLWSGIAVAGVLIAIGIVMMLTA